MVRPILGLALPLLVASTTFATPAIEDDLPVGNRFVESPAPKFDPNDLPIRIESLPGAPLFDPDLTSYFYIRPPHLQRGGQKVGVLMVLGMRGGDPTKSYALLRTLRLSPFLQRQYRDLIVVAPNHGDEDPPLVQMQRALDVLNDVQEWVRRDFDGTIDMERLYVTGHQSGAKTASALVHLKPNVFAGLGLSSAVFWGGTAAIWDTQVKDGIALFCGEDDSDRGQMERVLADWQQRNIPVQLTLGEGVANEGPPTETASEIVQWLWDLKGDSTTSGSGPASIGSRIVEPFLMASMINDLVRNDSEEPHQYGGASMQKPGDGSIIHREVQVTAPSDILFTEAVPEFHGRLPEDYDAREDTTYFLYVPASAPAKNAGLVVGASPSGEGDSFFSLFKPELDRHGLIFIGPWRLGPRRSYAERAQRVLDSLHDLRSKRSIDPDRILIYSYCSGTGMVSGVVRALPGVFKGAVLIGGAFPPIEPDIFSKLKVDCGVYLYAGERDWARRQVETAYRQMLRSPGIPAVEMIISEGKMHVQPDRSELTTIVDWMLDRNCSR
ncbi:MAG: hypothetical protein RL885_26610 [Planctomycetota bacterium]